MLFERRECCFEKDLPLYGDCFVLGVFFCLKVVFCQSFAVLLGQQQLQIDFLLFHLDQSFVDFANRRFKLFNDDVLFNDLLVNLVLLLFVLAYFLDICQRLLVFFLINYQQLLEMRPFLQLFFEKVDFFMQFLHLIFMFFLFPQKFVFE